jgi:sulfoxide reductase catalytic subunit YedY
LQKATSGGQNVIIKKPDDIRPSEITDRDIYRQRRDFIRASGQLALAGLAGGALLHGAAALARPQTARIKLPDVKKSAYSVDDDLTSYEDVTRYNNFYEFGTGKGDPAKYAHTLKTRPWTVRVEGEVGKPGEYDIDDLLKRFPLEERVYRFRCVEAWSMVVPWVGFPLAALIKSLEPASKAKFVEFTTLYDPQQMPGQRRRVLDWPYVEALRIDEAVHPLSLMVVGLYGEVLPNQNGAPLRLMVPWKYGFKNIKSIVKIRFTESMPRTTWAAAAPNEYGFYANVNPQVDHPRWSQKRERVLGGGFFASKRPTLMFNGYAEQVAHLYKGMDLRRFF